MTTVFFSYTHADEALRDELEVHLSLLKRQELIEAWHDRRIVAGSEIDATIEANLEAADIILLLVSPNFIASDYCFSREMHRALEKHEAKTARVIPVILRACDWHTAPFGKLLAVPEDGHPVASAANRDEAFAKVARAIRKAVAEVAGKKPTSSPVRSSGAEIYNAGGVAAEPPQEITSGGSIVRSSNLRLRKEFSELDRDIFVSETFEYTARFFEGSLAALKERNDGVAGRFDRVDSRTFTATVYANGKSVAYCRISLGGLSKSSSGITYSEQEMSYGNSFNELLTVEADDQKLYFKTLMGGSHSGVEHLSMQGVAEYYWGKLIERLQ
jgi:hypothetical protein